MMETYSYDVFVLFSLDERGAGRTRHSGGSRSAGGGKRKDTDANS
jgi:hypothetical protein